MSYPIIFETKIIKLSDGRILHCSLQGCNNDTCGRDREDFICKIYTKEEFEKLIESYKKDSQPYKISNVFDLKIGSRTCSIYDYGKHLETMLKRAKTLEELNKERIYYMRVLNSVEIIERKEDGKFNRIELNAEEWKTEENKYEYRYDCYVTFHTDTIREESEIVKTLENKLYYHFYIGKKCCKIK